MSTNVIPKGSCLPVQYNIRQNPILIISGPCYVIQRARGLEILKGYFCGVAGLGFACVSFSELWVSC